MVLDGDLDASVGRVVLPGGDAPEIVVSTALRASGWGTLAQRVGRNHADLVDYCERAMLLDDHHEWIRAAAGELVLGGDTSWQAMCAEWANGCLTTQDAQEVVDAVREALA